MLRRNLPERLQDAGYRSEKSHERGSRTNCGQAAKTALQLRMHNRLGTLKSALGRLDLLRSHRAAAAVVAELLQARGHNLGEVRLLVPVRNLDRLIQLALLKGAGHTRCELTRLLARRREIEVTVDHDRQRPDRHDEQHDYNSAGQPAHLRPEGHRAEANGLIVLKEA